MDILERRGGWLRISAKGTSGWAKLHQVRVGEGPQATKSGEGLAILKNVGETGRSGSTGIVATTGIRGMSAEEIKTVAVYEDHLARFPNCEFAVLATARIQSLKKQ